MRPVNTFFSFKHYNFSWKIAQGIISEWKIWHNLKSITNALFYNLWHPVCTHIPVKIVKFQSSMIFLVICFMYSLFQLWPNILCWKNKAIYKFFIHDIARGFLPHPFSLCTEQSPLWQYYHKTTGLQGRGCISLSAIWVVSLLFGLGEGENMLLLGKHASKFLVKVLQPPFPNQMTAVR